MPTARAGSIIILGHICSGLDCLRRPGRAPPYKQYKSFSRHWSRDRTRPLGSRGQPRRPVTHYAVFTPLLPFIVWHITCRNLILQFILLIITITFYFLKWNNKVGNSKQHPHFNFFCFMFRNKTIKIKITEHDLSFQSEFLHSWTFTCFQFSKWTVQSGIATLDRVAFA